MSFPQNFRDPLLLLLVWFLTISLSFSQDLIIEGKVEGEEGVENIVVLNRTQEKYTTTNAAGFFRIKAAKNDTLEFSAVQYKLYVHEVTTVNIFTKKLTINLEVNVDQLPEALIGFTLTGDLTKDVLSTQSERPIDFYDVGIPGYKGKPKTKSERVLFEASNFSKNLPIAIINAISGRTKALKKRLALEANTKFLNALKNRLSEVFFKEHELDKALRTEFFYFCAEDTNFESRCSINDLEALKFLKEKLIVYKENLATKE